MHVMTQPAPLIATDESEAELQARGDVVAGRLVDAAKVRAWVNSLRTDNLLPLPNSGR